MPHDRFACGRSYAIRVAEADVHEATGTHERAMQPLDSLTRELKDAEQHAKTLLLPCYATVEDELSKVLSLAALNTKV